jgi:hypothetical protein
MSEMTETDETMPFILIGGPMDGMDVDTRKSNTELVPAPHHFKHHGLEFQPLLYRKEADGQFHFVRHLDD